MIGNETPCSNNAIGLVQSLENGKIRPLCEQHYVEEQENLQQYKSEKFHNKSGIPCWWGKREPR